MFGRRDFVWEPDMWRFKSFTAVWFYAAIVNVMPTLSTRTCRPPCTPNRSHPNLNIRESSLCPSSIATVALSLPYYFVNSTSCRWRRRWAHTHSELINQNDSHTYSCIFVYLFWEEEYREKERRCGFCLDLMYARAGWGWKLMVISKEQHREILFFR